MYIAYFCFEKYKIDDIFDFLDEYCLFKDFKFIVDAFSSENQFFKAFDTKKYRIIIFDIGNHGKECIETASKIREIDNNAALIFFAGNKYYGYDAFLLYAADYIFKPVKYDRLEKTLDRILKNINVSKKYITVNNNKINTKINISTIIYIEVIGNVSCIHISSGNVVKAYITLSELERTLSNNPLFLRTHKSYIINMEYVSSMEGNSFIMKNGDIIAIRKNNCKEIKRIYQRFSLRKR